PRPRAHRNPVERRETHRAFDTAAVGQGAHGDAAAEMRHDHAARCHSRGNLAQALGDVLVGEAMKPVASHALRVTMFRNSEMIRNSTVAVMEGGVEAGNLEQLR